MKRGLLGSIFFIALVTLLSGVIVNHSTNASFQPPNSKQVAEFPPPNSSVIQNNI